MEIVNSKIAILILNWRAAQETLRCMEELISGSNSNHLVVLVDNGSHDGSSDTISTYLVNSSKSVESYDELTTCFALDSGMQIVLYKNPRNDGFAGGMNKAVDKALKYGAQSFLLLNNDAEISWESVLELKRVSDRFNGAVVGPVIMDYSNREKILFQGRSWESVLLGIGGQDTEDKLLPWATSYVEGSAMFLSSTFVAQKIARDGYLFDERFFLYCEDVDLSREAQRLGYRCLIVPTVRAYHKVSQSSGGVGSSTAYYYISRNRILLARKWLTRRKRILFYSYYIASRLILSIVRLKSAHERTIVLVVWQGLRDGFLGRFGAKNG